MPMEQGRVGIDGGLCLESRKTERDVIFRRQNGLEVNQARGRCEADAGDLDSIPPKWQAFLDDRPFGVRLQSLSKLVDLTDQLHGTLDRQTSGVGHRQTQLSRVALRKLGNCPKQDEEAATHSHSLYNSVSAFYR